MKIPKKVKIGGTTYNVITSVERLFKGDDCSAEINYYDSIIEISRNCGEQRAKRDFLHEVVHAIYDNLGYTEHDEKQIDELAGALYQVIVDNPEMFR